MAQDDNDGKDLAVADSSVADHHDEAHPGTAVVSRDAFTDPGLAAAPPARHRHRPEEGEARRAHGLHALLPLDRRQHLGHRGLHAVPDRVEQRRRRPSATRCSSASASPSPSSPSASVPCTGARRSWSTTRASTSVTAPAEATRPAPRPSRSSTWRTRSPASAVARSSATRLIGALIAFPLPAVVLFRDLGPQDENPVELLSHTMWKKGTRLTLDPSGVAIKASDVTLGLRVPRDPRRPERPRARQARGEGQGRRAAHAPPSRGPQRAPRAARTGRTTASSRTPRSARTSDARSRCTSSRRTTCSARATSRSSTSSNHCEVIFGPAKRPLPQLPIAVDAEGYLVAQSDFHEPVGPSFWERS